MLALLAVVWLACCCEVGAACVVLENPGGFRQHVWCGVSADMRKDVNKLRATCEVVFDDAIKRLQVA